MRSRVVAVRCFAEECAGGWEAHCVELGLSVRGESLDAVKRELDRLIHERIDDTLVKRRSSGRAGTPSPRRPLSLRLRYWGLFLAGRLGLRCDALRAPSRGFGTRQIARVTR